MKRRYKTILTLLAIFFLGFAGVVYRQEHTNAAIEASSIHKEKYTLTLPVGYTYHTRGSLDVIEKIADVENYEHHAYAYISTENITISETFTLEQWVKKYIFSGKDIPTVKNPKLCKTSSEEGCIPTVGLMNMTKGTFRSYDMITFENRGISGGNSIKMIAVPQNDGSTIMYTIAYHFAPTGTEDIKKAYEAILENIVFVK